MDIVSPLFGGFNPEDLFGGQASVDFAELFLIFGTIQLCLGLMVIFGKWWSH